MKNVFTLLIAALIGFSGCTSIQNTYSEADPEVDLTQYRSFAWANKDSTAIKNVLYENQLVQRKLTRSVEKELVSRGYQPNPHNPDLIIQYTIIVDESQRLLSYPIYSNVPVGPNSIWSPYSPVYPHNYSYAYNSNFGLINNYGYSNPYIMPPFNSTGHVWYNPNIPANIHAFQPTVTGTGFQQIEVEEGNVVIDLIDTKTNQLVWRGWSEGMFDNADQFENQVDDVVTYIFDRFPVKTIKNNIP